MANELLIETLRVLRTAGLEPQVEQARHLKVMWRDKHGRQRCLVVSRTPSDRRARAQNRALLRRLLKGGARG